MPEPSAIEYRAAAAVDPTPDGYAGYAATFFTVDSYATAFARGAFRKTLRERRDRVRVLWQHDPDHGTIGRHLTLKEDRTGLFVDVALIDDGDKGTRALKQLRGDGGLGLSFGFQTRADRAVSDDDALDLSQLPGATRGDVRVITDVALWETSVVTFPANELAVVTAVRERAAAVDPLAVLAEIRAAITSATLDETLCDAVAGLTADWLAAFAAPASHLAPPAAPERDRRDRDARLAGVLARARIAASQGGDAPCW